MKNILVTGGAGFIGSNFARYLLNRYPDYRVVVFDKLTYAGNPANLADLAGGPRYHFVKGDIADAEAVGKAIRDHDIDVIVNFAAETHVDRSILDPDAFIRTDVYGTYVLLEAVRQYGISRFVHVSTDEVYGHVPVGSSKESDKLEPRSPYAASKAGAEMLIHSYWITYQIPVLVTRGSNTFGPYQYPEKVMPVFITNAIDDEPLPVYGDGQQVRDWIFVEDHCAGIDCVLQHGQVGEAYNLGGGNPRVNLDIAHLILNRLGKPASLIRHIADRPGHDRRYSLDCSKLRALGWAPSHDFEDALDRTVRWYADREDWWRPLKTGEYLEYYRQNYGARLATAPAD